LLFWEEYLRVISENESAPRFTIMDAVTLRGKCPICGMGPLKPLPLGYSVFVAKPDRTHPIGGLLAYQCVNEMHIFFVRARDIEDEQERHSA
jgi:hypothetical protein